VSEDVVRERNDELRRLREFLYVDLQRVRSYYSQQNRGIIDSVLSRDTGIRQADVQARLLGIGASGGGSQQRAREESRSLQDLSYVIFEELFEEANLIQDVGEIAEDTNSWKNGHVHASFQEGSIIRYTGLIQILDPQFVKSRFEQFSRLVTGIAGAQIGKAPDVAATPPVRRGGSTKPGVAAAKGDAAREKLKEELLSTLMGGSSIGQIKDIIEAVSAFTNDSISVRVLPCGRENPDYHFAGTLLSRSEYIQEEREALFGRYGVYLNDWTVVMQIARIPSESPPVAPDFARSFIDEASGKIDRTTFEQLVIDLIGDFEQKGLSEGARYPAISTTILAIYREFA
jgi:hypothetical protein